MKFALVLNSMWWKRIVACWMVGLIAPGRLGAAERILFNDGWLFKRGEPLDAPEITYAKVRPWLLGMGHYLLPGCSNADLAIGVSDEPAPWMSHEFAQAGLDESGWRSVRLPHDWGIEGPFQQAYESATGKLPWWGVGWYRKQFWLDPADAGKRIYLDVDGAMSFALVWCNGRFAGGWPYGYTSFRVDLTRHVKFGQTNVVAIRLDNPPRSSRWYPGGGLYRNVWLVKCAPVHLAHWGVFVTTPRVGTNSAEIHVELRIVNTLSTNVRVRITGEIDELGVLGPLTRPMPGRTRPKYLWLPQLEVPYDFTIRADNPDGRPLRRIPGPSSVVEVPAGSVLVTNTAYVVRHPLLWSIDEPNLYRFGVRLARDGHVVDEEKVIFGIRQARFGVDGFELNGARVRIRGVCNHHDLGALGAALNVRALERQIELLKSMGVNAIRTSHNPPAPELLELCDRMGMLVLVEAFDCWLTGKNTNDYHVYFSDWHEKDLRAMIRRDRNHPSVVLWSIGNEVLEQREPDGWKLAMRLVDICHQEDPTRPVTAALHTEEATTNGFQHVLDVYGFNYAPGWYGSFRAANPGLPVLASETVSCVSSRGEYFFPVSTNKRDGRANFQVSSYDVYAPRWAYPPDVEFEAQARHRFVAGEFVWTGFDYLGEPTPYDRDTTNLIHFTDPQMFGLKLAERAVLGRILVPSRSSYFGIMDLCGFPKDRYYLYRSVWRPEVPTVHILPHWTWPERVGQIIPVHVYTSGDEVELFLNGRSLGRRRLEPYRFRLVWDDVRYEPGQLRAVAYRSGRLWATTAVKTAGEPAQLVMSPDRGKIWADGRDLCFVTVGVLDRDGNLVPRAGNLIRFKIRGPGEVVATDNGDPTCHESFQSRYKRAFNGLCLVVVQAVPGCTGPIVLRVESDGLKPATVTIHAVRPANMPR